MIYIDKLYKAIKDAETGGEDNPYIRTKVKDTPGGSTAFGPVQITGRLAEGAYRNGYLKESNLFYAREMRPRYILMVHNGNSEGMVSDYNARYDYGGDCEFDGDKYGECYAVMAKEIMIGVAVEAHNDVDKFIEKWRGKREYEDEAYYKKVRQGLLK